MPVEGIAVIPQLHEHVLAPERVDQLVERSPCCARAIACERSRHRALATAGEKQVASAAQLAGELGELQPRCPLLAAQLRPADRAGERGVAVDAVGEHHDVMAPRIGSAVARLHGPERQLRPEHRGHVQRARRLGEAHHPVETVVVGERETAEPQPRRLLHQLVRMAGAVEEREVGVAVQLRVHATEGSERLFDPPKGSGPGGPW